MHPVPEVSEASFCPSHSPVRREKGSCCPSSTSSDDQRSCDGRDSAVKCLWLIPSPTTSSYVASGKCPDLPRPQFPPLLNGYSQLPRVTAGHGGRWKRKCMWAVTGCMDGVMSQDQDAHFSTARVHRTPAPCPGWGERTDAWTDNHNLERQMQAIFRCI